MFSTTSHSLTSKPKSLGTAAWCPITGSLFPGNLLISSWGLHAPSCPCHSSHAGPLALVQTWQVCLRLSPGLWTCDSFWNALPLTRLAPSIPSNLSTNDSWSVRSFLPTLIKIATPCPFFLLYFPPEYSLSSIQNILYLDICLSSVSSH